MHGRRRFQVLERLVLVIGVGSVAACTSGAPTDAPSTMAVDASPTDVPAGPTATAAAGPAATAATRVLVHGTGTCALDDDSDSQEGDVRTTRATLRCDLSTSDARASGELTGAITLVYVKEPGLEVNHWSADVSVANFSGKWSGVIWGSDFWNTDGELSNVGTGLLTGSGAYDGLVYRLFSVQEPGVEGLLLSGWVEPAP